MAEKFKLKPVTTWGPLMFPEIMGKKIHKVIWTGESRPLYWKTCGPQRFTGLVLPKESGIVFLNKGSFYPQESFIYVWKCF